MNNKSLADCHGCDQIWTMEKNIFFKEFRWITGNIPLRPFQSPLTYSVQPEIQMLDVIYADSRAAP